LFVLLWGVRVRFDTCCTTDSPSYMTGSAPANFFKKILTTRKSYITPFVSN
jgi:hypothetical protein